MPFCPICRCEYERDVERCPDCDAVLVETIPPENPDAEPYAALVEIYEAAGDEEALVIKGLLETEDIMCSLSSDIPHTVVPLNVDGLGAVRISVSQNDERRAREIIDSHREKGSGR